MVRSIWIRWTSWKAATNLCFGLREAGESSCCANTSTDTTKTGSLVQAIDAAAQEKVGRDVERHAVEQIHHVDGLPRGGQLADERADPPVKDVEVAHPVLDEHGPDQGPAVGPQLPVGGEDGVAQEGAPDLVEALALAVLAELGRQDRLDVLRLPRHQEAHPAQEGDLDAVGAFRRGPVEYRVVKVVELVDRLVVPGLDEEGETWNDDDGLELDDVRPARGGQEHAEGTLPVTGFVARTGARTPPSLRIL